MGVKNLQSIIFAKQNYTNYIRISGLIVSNRSPAELPRKWGLNQGFILKICNHRTQAV